MLISKEQYYSGGESICRNPSLQTMFSMIGAVEKAGSGADTIVQGWNEAKFGTPIISERSEPNKVELMLPIISLTDNSVSKGDSKGDSKSLQKIREKISKRKKVPYEESSKIIIGLCCDWLSTQELANKIGYSVSHLKNKIIPRMVSDGFIEPFDKISSTNPEQKYRSTEKGKRNI